MEKLHSAWRWTWKVEKAKSICLRWGSDITWPVHSSHWSHLHHKMLDLGSGWEEVSSLKLSVHWGTLIWSGTSVDVGIQAHLWWWMSLGICSPSSTGEAVSYWHPFDFKGLPVKGNSNSVFQAAEILQSHLRKPAPFYALSRVLFH